MPNYDFECKKCGLIYEELAEYDKTEKYKGVKCPKCKSTRKNKLMSSASFNFTNPEGTARWNNAQSGHDYRYKHKAPSVAKERENAAKHSHVGSDPYSRIDDISSGKNFGKVR